VKENDISNNTKSNIMDNNENRERRDEIFSKAVRAGKRTYFFDVKATKADDYYLTVTESKKKFTEDGKFHFEKHKLFLYKEDFEKFALGLYEAIDYIQKEKGVYEGYEESQEVKETNSKYSTKVKFDDLV
jgi:hypothetical protein|tara:strand:- start:401 stop:790 length:390 start_codon:yes stop_codon:yes gene_type:complete